MSCATTSATLISRSVPLAALMTTDAASSQDCVLVPMRSVTVETRTGPAWPYGWIVSQRQSYRTRAPADKRYVAVSWRQCTAPLLVSVADRLGDTESFGADTASVGPVKPEWANEELRTARLALRHPVASDLEAVLRIHQTPEAVAHNPSDAIEDQAGAGRLLQRWIDQWRRQAVGYWAVSWRGDPSVASTASPDNGGQGILAFERADPCSDTPGRPPCPEFATRGSGVRVPSAPPPAGQRPFPDPGRGPFLV